jgi:hypothetical protein
MVESGAFAFLGMEWRRAVHQNEPSSKSCEGDFPSAAARLARPAFIAAREKLEIRDLSPADLRFGK